MDIDIVIANRIVTVMNRALAADPRAIQELIGHRVACNHELARDPSIQVLSLGGERPTVGILGLLNGLTGQIEEPGPHQGWGRVAAVYTVECTNIPRHQVGDATVQDPCPICGAVLQLGQLERFVTVEP
jgi:hypothetical protein